MRWFRQTWNKYPPVHQAVAAYLGIKPGGTREPRSLADSAGAILDDLMDAGDVPQGPSHGR